MRRRVDRKSEVAGARTGGGAAYTVARTVASEGMFPWRSCTSHERCATRGAGQTRTFGMYNASTITLAIKMTLRWGSMYLETDVARCSRTRSRECLQVVTQ